MSSSASKITRSLAKSISVYDGMPYAALSDLEILAVEKAFRTVWSETTKQFHVHKIDFRSAREDGISTAIVRTFDALWKQDRGKLSELAEVFSPVPTYDGKQAGVDFLGRPLDKRPDFAFTRKDTTPGVSMLDSQLFVEAKLVDESKTIGLYCGKGLERFVSGKYAWAVPQAMMLGYVRNASYKLPDTLRVHLNGHGKKTEYALKVEPTPFAHSKYEERMHFTTHGRSWSYPETLGAPGDINVFHLWLRVDNIPA